MNRKYVLYILLCIPIGFLSAQDTSVGKLKVFVEGWLPDFNFLRSQMPFVDFVNDPQSSDVHVIVTSKRTASGGNHYYLLFNPVTISSLGEITLNCITSFQDTEDDKRNRFSESMKSGILIFANEKKLNYKIQVIEDQTTVKNSSDSSSVDPWNNWIFNIRVNGGLEAEEQKKAFEYETSFEVNRETELWRIRNEYEYGRDETFIQTDDEAEDEIHVFNQEQNLHSRVVRSISSHWSTGIFLSGNQTTYRNIKYNANASAAVEYNIYPWSQINERTFTIAYYIGPHYYDYYKTTVLNKEEEWLWAENLQVDLRKVEQWGRLDVWLHAEHYFPDFEFYSIETGARLSIRMARGLFFDFEIDIEKINNQLYLQAEELSAEDILLNTRKLPTSFEFSTEIGISYRFGSIYNNVVNHRL